MVEAGVGFESRFRLGAAFANREIMMPEAEPPFEGFAGVGLFKGMGLTLRLFDEFAVSYAGGRPVFWEMVGI